MTSMPQKTAIASAISLVIGTMAGVPASADTMTQVQVTDVGSTLNGVNGGGSGTYSSTLDGNSGGFRFGNINPETYNNVVGWIGDVGPLFAEGNPNPTGSFSTGFLFSSTPFVPFTFGNGLSGDINVDNAGNLSLDFADLDFGGNFQTGGPGIDFLLPPDGEAAVNWVTEGANNDEKLVSFQWNHLITTAEDPSGQFTGFNARWIVEGVAAVTDGPPLIFINDAGGNPSPVSGDISQDIFVGSTYVDQGAVFQDVVDGDISANVTTTPADLTNVDTSSPGSFTVDYDCPDSAANNGVTRTRTVNILAGSDTTPPDITLLSPTEPEPGRNDPNPETVNILQGKTYVDAGATCIDNVDGDISDTIATSGTVNTDIPGTYPIDFDCSDAAGNAATTEIRTVNVIADTEAPVISLIGANPFTIAVGSVWNDPGATCTDTNPVDTDPVDISDRLVIDPLDIDTGDQGATTVTYDCTDLAGNDAAQETRTVNVVAGQNFRVISMTVSDLDADGLAGCFKFNSLNAITCAGANPFSSDDSGSIGEVGTGSERILGVGADTDAEGNPIGIDFSQFQPITDFITPPPTSVLTEAKTLPVGRIAPGFLFAKFPFVPVTFDPSSTPGSNNPEVASEPDGFVTVSGSTGLLTMGSLPFGGLYQSSAPNLFFLDPDEGTFNGVITQVNDDDDGTTRTFNYEMTWNHLITEIEDPTGQFVNFDAFWRLEGVIMAESTPFVINAAPRVISVKATQDDRDPTTIVVGSSGLVTVIADATDPDGDELIFDWSQNAVTPVGPTDQPSFTFDPADLRQGTLGLVVTVTDDAAEPLSDVGEIVLIVERNAPALSASEDSDGDGTPDADEGFGDDDGDSIANYQDPIDGTVEPGSNRIDFRAAPRGDIVTSAGRLRLGRVSAASGDGDFIATEEEIGQYGGVGATPTSNSQDRLNRVLAVGPIPNGIRDFIVDGLTPGETVQIVVPQDQPLPSVPEYRKYTPATGWIPFNRTSGNAWASAPKDNGVCPPPGDSAYDAPVDDQGNTVMVQGDECVRLTIVDGGPNDADRNRNGIIRDPGTVSSNGTASSAGTDGNNLSSGCTLADSANQNNRGDWWLVLTGLLGLFGFNRSRNATVRGENKR